MELPAFKIAQNEKTFYLTFLTVKQLTSDDIAPDVWSPDNSNGYQREMEISRARKFARYMLNKENVSPTSILLSIRGKVEFVQEKGSASGKLIIPDGTKIHVVDGQHRSGGIKEAIKEAKKKDIDLDVTFPAVIMLPQLMGEKEAKDPTYTEAKQFVLINRTQKRVRADLSDRFIQRLTPEQMQELDVLGTPEKLERKQIAINVIDKLRNKKEGPWYQNIKLSGAPAGGQGIVSETTFKRHLEDILQEAPFKNMSDDELADLLDAYWSAWRDLCPNAFDNPDEYVLQKSTGVSVIHMLLPDVVRWLENTNKEYTKDDFFGVMNNMTIGVTDNFWSSGGEIGKMGGGEKLFKELYKRFRDNFLATNVKALQESPSS